MKKQTISIGDSWVLLVLPTKEMPLILTIKKQVYLNAIERWIKESCAILAVRDWEAWDNGSVVIYPDDNDNDEPEYYAPEIVFDEMIKLYVLGSFDFSVADKIYLKIDDAINMALEQNQSIKRLVLEDATANVWQVVEELDAASINSH